MEAFSLYVENIPKALHWKGPGHVFARFKKQEDASKAIERLNEFVPHGAKLSVSMEKYTGGRPKWNKKIHGDNGKGEEEISRKLSLVRNTCRIVEGSNGRTKEAVNQQHKNIGASICQGNQGIRNILGLIEEADLRRLKRCLIGESSTVTSVDNIQDRLIKWGLGDIKVQRLGGKLYLLSFEDDELFIMLEDLNWSYLKGIFSKVVPWSEDIMGLARVTWLGCWAFRFTVGITLQSKELQNYRALLKHSRGDLEAVKGIGSATLVLESSSESESMAVEEDLQSSGKNSDRNLQFMRDGLKVINKKETQDKETRRRWGRNLELRPIDYDGMLTTRARELSVMGLLNQVGLSCGSTVELAVKASDDAKYNKGLSILAPTQVILSLDKCIDVRDEPRIVLSKFVEGRNKIKEKRYGSLREILNKGLTEFEIRKRDLASCRVKKDKKLLESSELSGRLLSDSNLANMRDLLKGSKAGQ
ncbi:hypothetical protein V6N13_009386 [Hibiscus sabdariffa]